MRIFVRTTDEHGTGKVGRLPTCPPTCRGTHELRLWVIQRKGTPWGHFATANICGESRVIDASLPTRVPYIPNGAEECSPEEVANLWHEDNESHVFGGPNIAKALREAVKAQDLGS